ncbi:NucA/NucB deoxyribonuclease domain-containing protein [Actinoplanes campanulatus]|nr:hypothetical protein [Actinoplanes capillaceus]
MLRKWAAALSTATILAAFTGAQPAAAAPPQALADDLRTACANHDAEAAGQRGWARSRFEQCHHLDLDLELKKVNTGAHVGWIFLDLWVLATASDGDRKVTYEVSVEEVGISSHLNDALGYISVNFTGCNTADVACTGTPLFRSDTIQGWFNQPKLATIVATSPNGVGTGTYKTVDLLAMMSLNVEYRDGQTIPYSNPVAVLNASRFDSAGSLLGNGKHHGTVFTDFVPVLDLDARTGSNHEAEAKHVRHALRRPELTFPSFVGKGVPGEVGSGHPLHRLMNSSLSAQNHNGSVTICKDVWGQDYATGGMECDEFPFQSTYEGSSTSTGGNPARWHGSARPIDGDQNGAGGTALSNFYGAQRLLDNGDPTVPGSYGDAFYVNVLT